MDIQGLSKRQREYFQSGITRPVKWRIEKLKILRKTIKHHTKAISEALYLDLGKSKEESYITEIGIVQSEIGHAIRNLERWARPKPVMTHIAQWPAKCRITNEPYGIVYILGAWNYPFQLNIKPLVGAIAAGNCAIVKPSELAPNTSAALAKMIDEAFDPDHVCVIEGDGDVSNTILDTNPDYIFFTGSKNVGKIIMTKAAENLIPVTLELGGKCPCIVDASADIDTAAKRIISGKFLCAGQTCIAPDFILADTAIELELLGRMQYYIKQFYGNDPITSDEYPKIINERHFNRLSALINSGETVIGGETDSGNLKIAPTVLSDVSWDDEIMADEIFGPILPVISYDNLQDEIIKLHTLSKPLALYIFSNDDEIIDFIMSNVPSGGACINDTIMHMVTSNMPFGGIGGSGMGAYNGKYTYQTFSHRRSVLYKNRWEIKLRYPPFRGKMGIFKWLLR